MKRSQMISKIAQTLYANDSGYSNDHYQRITGAARRPWNALSEDEQFQFYLTASSVILTIEDNLSLNEWEKE